MDTGSPNSVVLARESWTSDSLPQDQTMGKRAFKKFIGGGCKRGGAVGVGDFGVKQSISLNFPLNI